MSAVYELLGDDGVINAAVEIFCRRTIADTHQPLLRERGYERAGSQAGITLGPMFGGPNSNMGKYLRNRTIAGCPLGLSP